MSDKKKGRQLVTRLTTGKVKTKGKGICGHCRQEAEIIAGSDWCRPCAIELWGKLKKKRAKKNKSVRTVSGGLPTLGKDR